MPKNIFVYPCDSFVGKSVAKAFSAAGHAVSGVALTGANVPPSVSTVIRAEDSDVAVAHKQLLLTADVVVYDLLGNERATRDAVVQLAQQPYGGREVFFVAVSSPLVWAATRPSPGALLASITSGAASAAAGTAAANGGTGSGGAGEWGAGRGEGTGAGDGDAASAGGRVSGDGGEEAPWPGARRTGTGGGSGAGTGSGDGEEGAGAGAGQDPLEAVENAMAVAGLFGAPVENVLARSASTPRIAPIFRAPEDVSRRLPAAPARAALAVEHLVLRAGRKGRLRTAVVCPGLLYGEGEDDLAFCDAFKAAWTWQSLPTHGSAASASAPPPRLLVYGRGHNILPTLHVSDLAAYVMALAGLQSQPQLPAAAPPAAAATPAAAAASALGGTSPPAPPASGLTVGSSGLKSGSVAGGLVASGGTLTVGSGAPGPGSGPVNYYLVTDGSRCTQAELVAAIAAAMGLTPEEGAIEFVPEPELHLHPAPLRTRMMLDLSLATTALPSTAPTSSTSGPSATTTSMSPASAPAPAGFALSRPGGLPAHLADVAAEFRSARRLTPLRILVTGPPLSGKTHLARRLAHRYGLSYISVPLLLAAAADPRIAAAVGLNPAMDPALLRAAQLEVAAGPSATIDLKKAEKEREKDKEGAPNPGWLPTGGRVSAKTLGALLASALGDPRVAARCRGFVLDGFPRSAAQARAAFYGLQVDEAAAAALAAEQSHVTLKVNKSHKSLAANPSTPKLGRAKDGDAEAAAALAAGGHAGGGAFADVYDVPTLPNPMKLVANSLTAPTHVIELDVPEEELRGRLAALAAAADEAVTRVTGEPAGAADADKKGPGGTPIKKPAGPGGSGPGGKGGAGAGVVPRELLLAATLGHNGEAGFGRRLAAYGTWRADDAEDLRKRAAAAQAAWDAERARQEVETARLAAEASTLKAKRRRARAAAAAAAGGGAVTILGEDDEDDVAAGNSPDVAAAPPAAPELPQHGGLIALSLDAGGATHIRLTNPTGPEGPLITIPVQPPPSAALLAAGPAAATSGAVGPTSITNTVATAAAAAVAPTPPAPPPPLLSLERSVEALLGPPHNLAGFPEPGPMTAAGAAVAPAAAAADSAKSLLIPIDRAEAAAAPQAATAAGLAAAAAVDAGADASYALRWRGARGAAVRQYLLKHVVPVVTAALAEVALARTGGPAAAAAAAGGGAISGGPADAAGHLTPPPQSPASTRPGTAGSVAGGGPGSSGKEALLHVARALAAAAAEAEAAFVDPYSDPSYAIQLAKIDAKAAREAARAAYAAAKAEREAAARQQQQQQQQEEQQTQ